MKSRTIFGVAFFVPSPEMTVIRTVHLIAIISLLFLPFIVEANCLIYENGLYRLSLCEENYELVRLDDPLEAGRFHGSSKRRADTLILLDFRADSLIRAEFLIEDYQLSPIYLAPNLQVIFRALDGPLIQSRLTDENQKLLESWEILDSLGPRVIHYVYNDYLDTEAAFRYLATEKDGEFWMQDTDESGRILIVGHYEQGVPSGIWTLYRLTDGYRWRSESIIKHKKGKVAKERKLKKQKALENLPF